MATLGDRLTELIEKQQLHQKEIAGNLDIKFSTFNGYVNGIREPSIDTLHKIAKYFEVSVDYLTGFVDDPSGREKIYQSNIEHLSDELNEFISDPENERYIEIASYIKDKLDK